MTAMPYQSKYHIAINGQGYIISHKRNGEKWYQKRLAPAFVNKFGSGDVSYRDSTFWQFWANTNWRNGSKQLQLDDPGKFWKSSDINTSELNEIQLSRGLTSLGQVASGIKINALSAWRTSQSWWDANYLYRKQLTITAGAGAQVPANYPVKITEDTAALQTASKVRSDRKDWRVLYFNGSAWTDLTRDYVSTTVTMFGLQAAIPAGEADTNYYIYYGYSAASTTKQAATEAEYNSVYGMFGTTPDANSLAIYHFREGTGQTVADDSSSANTGSGTSLAWVTDQKYGWGGDFTSAIVGAGSSLSLGSMTLEGWFNPDVVTGTQQLINKEENNAIGYELKLSGANVVYRTKDSSDVITSITSTTSLVAGTTYHIAGTHDGSTMRLYINGTLEASTSSSTPKTQTANTVIGRIAGGSTAADYNGKMSHIRISNTARSAFAYVLTSEPTITAGTETATQAAQSTADAYAGGSDGKIYKHDGATTWTEQFDTRRIVWYETGTNENLYVGDNGGTEKAASQSFTVPAAVNLQAVQVYIRTGDGAPSGDVTVRIETNNAGVPSGTLVGASLTTTISTTSITGTYQFLTATFASSVALAASTTYWIVVKTAAMANDNNYIVASNSAGSYANGNVATSVDGGSTWSAQAGKDMYFRVLGETTQVNDFLVSSVGGTLKMLIATGDISSQTNGNARLYSFDGTTWALEKSFATTTESQITKLAEYNSKLYVGVGPQARVYEGTSPTSWTLSKDIDVPSKPGYIYALKEYNQRLYAGGGAPEFLYDKHYNGFWYTYDQNTWQSLYPFDFTEIRAFEF